MTHLEGRIVRAAIRLWKSFRPVWMTEEEHIVACWVNAPQVDSMRFLALAVARYVKERLAKRGKR